MKIFIFLKFTIFDICRMSRFIKSSYIDQYNNSYIGLYKNVYKTLGDLAYIGDLPLRGFTVIYRSIYARPPSVLLCYYIDRYMNYYIDRYMKVCICETRYIYRSKFVKNFIYRTIYINIDQYMLPYSAHICFHISGVIRPLHFLWRPSRHGIISNA